jgi:Bacteriophage lambda head decoration protein D
METLTMDNLFAGGFPAHGNSVTIVQGEGTLARGAVLGKITKGAISIAAGTNTGNGAAGAITRLAKAVVGVYTLTCISTGTNVGTFRVLDPNGYRLADLVVAQAYNNGHFSITIADGSADFVVGDSFSVTVAAGSGNYRLVNSSNTDGSDVPDAILAESRVVAAATDETSVPVYETGEFNSAALTFGGSDTFTTHRDALKKKNIFLRAIQAQ